MDRPNKTENENPMDAAVSEWKKRSPKERRGKNKDKRSADGVNYLSKGGKERRKSGERRDKWMRIGKWRSISVFDE